MNLENLEGMNIREVNALHLQCQLSHMAYLGAETTLKATKSSKDRYIEKFTKEGESKEFITGATHIMDHLIEAGETIATKNLEEYLDYKERLKNMLEH